MVVTLITGDEPHYQVGLISGLLGRDLELEVVGGESIAAAPAVLAPGVRFRNIRPSLRADSPRRVKLAQVLGYYGRLIRYAARTRSRLFHIQWPYKLVVFDRTVLNLYYKALGKKLVFTAHNVDRSARDGNGSHSERFSLRFLYRVVDHIIVHTNKMKEDLVKGFGVPEGKVSVIPHGLNSAVPESTLTREEARAKLRLAQDSRVLLFFGLIDHYKGLDYLVEALKILRAKGPCPRLIVAGKVKGSEAYWREIEAAIETHSLGSDVVKDIRHIPDEEVEIYFKAADALVLPYRGIFQSGVLFLAFRFGLPVIASNVGSLSEDVLEGKTGFIFKPGDAEDLAQVIERYFGSELFRGLARNRKTIQEYAQERYSWGAIGKKTLEVYSQLLRN